jgi:hypothetical protein
MICKCTKNIREVIRQLTMIGKLPKSEAWKQSDPNRLGLLLHPRYSSRVSHPVFKAKPKCSYYICPGIKFTHIPYRKWIHNN